MSLAVVVVLRERAFSPRLDRIAAYTIGSLAVYWVLERSAVYFGSGYGV